MDVPAVLQRYANDVVKGKYRDIVKLWTALQKFDKSAATKLRKLGAAGPLDKDMLAAVSAAHTHTRKGGPNRGHRDLSAKPAPRVTSTQSRRGEASLNDMTLVDDDVFYLSEDELAQVYELDDLRAHTVGYCFASCTKAAVVLLERINDRVSGPCVIITKQVAFDNCGAEHRDRLKVAYGPIKITLHFMEKGGVPVPVQCLVFQIGDEDLLIRDADIDDVVVVKSASPPAIKVSIQRANTAGTKDFKKLEETFAKDALAVIGSKHIVKDSVVKFNRTRNDVQFLKNTVDVQEGTAWIQPDVADEVWRRSGSNGFMLRPYERDNKFSILRVKGEPTLEAARTVAKNLDQLAYGTLFTAGGYVVRVRAEDSHKAYVAYNAELSQVVGNNVIAMAKADACFFEVTGVPARMTDLELATALKMRVPGSLEYWTCHPETRLGWTGPGFKKMLVKASSQPPKTWLKVQYDTQVLVFALNERERRNKDMTVMQRAEVTIAKRSYMSVAANDAQKSEPKVVTKPFTVSMNGKKWSDQDDDDGEDDRDMEVDRTTKVSKDDDEETPLEEGKFYHDCEDSHAASTEPAECDATAAPARTSRKSKTTPSASTDAMQAIQKEFDAKMEQLEQQRQGMHATTNAHQETLNERDRKHKKNMDAMYAQIQAMQDTHAAQQAASNSRLAAIEESFRNFQTQTLTAQAAAANAAATAAKENSDRFAVIMVALGKLQQGNDATPAAPPAAVKAPTDPDVRRDRSHSPRRESARSVATNS